MGAIDWLHTLLSQFLFYVLHNNQASNLVLRNAYLDMGLMVRLNKWHPMCEFKMAM